MNIVECKLGDGLDEGLEAEHWLTKILKEPCKLVRGFKKKVSGKIIHNVHEDDKVENF